MRWNGKGEVIVVIQTRGHGGHDREVVVTLDCREGCERHQGGRS